MRHMLVVANVPPSYGADQLRYFFEDAVEADAIVACHFKRRTTPLLRNMKEVVGTLPGTQCWCGIDAHVWTPMEFACEHALRWARQHYHGTAWPCAATEQPLSRCCLHEVALEDQQGTPPPSGPDSRFLTRGERRKQQLLGVAARGSALLARLPELHGLPGLCRGNVGTPLSRVELERLPSGVRASPSVASLRARLRDQRGSLSSVAHVYDTASSGQRPCCCAAGQVVSHGVLRVWMLPCWQADATRHQAVASPASRDHHRTRSRAARGLPAMEALLPSRLWARSGSRNREGHQDEEEEEEDWDRHERLKGDWRASDGEYDKPGWGARHVEALFEEVKEVEVTWEKGGSGLVMYTDDGYWAARRGTDVLDVDNWGVDPRSLDSPPDAEAYGVRWASREQQEEHADRHPVGRKRGRGIRACGDHQRTGMGEKAPRIGLQQGCGQVAVVDGPDSDDEGEVDDSDEEDETEECKEVVDLQEENSSDSDSTALSANVWRVCDGSPWACLRPNKTAPWNLKNCWTLRMMRRMHWQPGQALGRRRHSRTLNPNSVMVKPLADVLLQRPPGVQGLGWLGGVVTAGGPYAVAPLSKSVVAASDTRIVRDAAGRAVVAHDWASKSHRPMQWHRGANQ